MLAARLARSAAIVFAISLCACVNMDAAGSTEDCGQALTSGPAVDTIRALEERGSEGNVKGVALEVGERMFWPDYVSVQPDGKVMTKQDMMAQWRPNPWASMFQIKELNIKVQCDTAIVVGLSEALWIGAPADAKPIHFRWLNVWTRANGEWRMSASQFTRF